MGSPEILVERRDRVLHVTIDRLHSKNALTLPMWETLARLLTEFGENPDDHVLVLAGSDGVFCAGGDISGAQAGAGEPPPRDTLIDRTEKTVTALCSAIHHCPKPVIAAVDGIAAGAGANIAFGCDLVIASERARFCEIFIQHGLTMDSGGTWLLPRLVGLQKAKELAFYGDWVDAEQAQAIGLVNIVVPVDNFDETVGRWANRLAERSTASIGAMKRSLNSSFAMSFDEALSREAGDLADRLRSPEVRNAIKAFFDRSRKR
ncbi:MAG: enoyl-CoA hydratase-related protein [Parasphingopyxis sp.]|uniref:enoyl-CoA hydratase/isomerase family protein n=1 Tax=Parasphingopyxis sp. TaxID=1920299 RepID=UPI00260B9FE7|nr:enoyl-CoA hydratase-related protein [uncultured Parasphingopyxis sp.]